MAKVRRVGPDIEVRLTLGEKIAGLRGDIRVPVSAVRSVDVVDEPLAAITGLRAPGLHWPGRVKIGTWRSGGRRTFAVARARRPAVQIELHGQTFDRLVVSVDDAHSSVGALR